MKGKAKKSPRKREMNPDEQLKKLGDRIRQLRKDAGYVSYEPFAYEHDISRAQFGRYENGQDMKFSSLIRVANAFGMTLEEFFSEGFG